MKAEKFLDIYRSLEDALEKKYAGKKRHSSSVVFEYINDPEAVNFSEKLDICREVRNILSHNGKVDGKSLVQPSDYLGEFLLEVIDFVTKPALAINFGTQKEDIFSVNITQNVLKVMSTMDKKGFSHVPVFENSVFFGVFSYGTVFNYILKTGDTIENETNLFKLKGFLPIASHTENYMFSNKTLTVQEAKNYFDKVSEKNKRLSVIFITETGKQDEPLLAMLTPWDVMNKEIKF